MAKQKLISSFIAAERIGVTPDYIRKLCQRGKIQAEKMGNNWLLKESAIKNVLRKRRPRVKQDS